MAKGVCSYQKQLYVFLIFITLITLVLAVPPVTTVQQFPTGYIIVESVQQILKVNTDYNYNMFLYNSSTGKLVNNATVKCHFDLANSTGNIITHNNLTYNLEGHWYYLIKGGNFSYIGRYFYGVSCQDNFGGVLSGEFQTTTTGLESSGASTVIVFALIGLAFIFLVLSMFFKEDYWMVKSLFQFLSVGAGLIAINSARIIASDSDALGTMGEIGIILMIVVMSIFFLWIFVYAFIEIIKVFKAKGDLRWDYS